MLKHSYGVALYPPPEVGGFTATEDKNTHNRFSAFLGFDVISHADFIAHRVIKTVSLYQATVVKITADSTA